MIEIRSPLGLSLDQLAAGMTHCFEEYVIPAKFTPELLSSLFRVDSVDLAQTLIATDGDTMVGVLLVCRRGQTTRVGAMAVAKSHRGQRLGHRLMDRLFQDSRTRGDRRIVLEAISHNERAIAFYRQVGFAIQYRLLGFTLAPEPAVVRGRGREIDFRDMAKLILRRPRESYSWEADAATVAQLANPCRGYLLQGLTVGVAPASDESLLFRALGLTGSNDVDKLKLMCGFLARLYPGRKFKIPPYFPEPEFADALLGAGFEQDPLSQVQMELFLTPP